MQFIYHLCEANYWDYNFKIIFSFSIYSLKKCMWYIYIYIYNVEFYNIISIPPPAEHRQHRYCVHVFISSHNLKVREGETGYHLGMIEYSVPIFSSYWYKDKLIVYVFVNVTRGSFWNGTLISWSKLIKIGYYWSVNLN